MRALREEVPEAGVPEEARPESQQGQGRGRWGQTRVGVGVRVSSTQAVHRVREDPAERERAAEARTGAQGTAGQQQPH